MQNKLLNPAEHGDPSIPRPRCAKNLDVLRGCVVAKNVEGLEAAYEKLQAAFKVLRVKNTHDPETVGWNGGYRSLLVNFIYEPGVTWGQLFGDRLAFDFRDFGRIESKEVTPIVDGKNHFADLWLDYVMQDVPNLTRLYGLEGLQIIASEHSNEPVRMIAELQLVLEPYFDGRGVSHLLFKVGRCDTGSMEMVRDFFQEYFHKEAERNESLQKIRDIAMAVKEGRTPPERAENQYEAPPYEDPTEGATDAFADQVQQFGDNLARHMNEEEDKEKQGTARPRSCLQ
jgi:hypothetical protein